MAYLLILRQDGPTTFTSEGQPLFVRGILRQMVVMDLYAGPFGSEDARDVAAAQASIYEENEGALFRRR